MRATDYGAAADAAIQSLPPANVLLDATFTYRTAGLKSCVDVQGTAAVLE